MNNQKLKTIMNDIVNALVIFKSVNVKLKV